MTTLYKATKQDGTTVLFCANNIQQARSFVLNLGFIPLSIEVA